MVQVLGNMSAWRESKYKQAKPVARDHIIVTLVCVPSPIPLSCFPLLLFFSFPFLFLFLFFISSVRAAMIFFRPSVFLLYYTLFESVNLFFYLYLVFFVATLNRCLFGAITSVCVCPISSLAFTFTLPLSTTMRLVWDHGLDFGGKLT